MQIKLTPSFRVLLEKLVAAQLIKKLHTLLKTNIHYCVHKSHPLVAILNHMSAVRTLVTCKINFNIILSCTPISRVVSSLQVISYVLLTLKAC